MINIIIISIATIIILALLNKENEKRAKRMLIVSFIAALASIYAKLFTSSKNVQFTYEVFCWIEIIYSFVKNRSFIKKIKLDKKEKILIILSIIIAVTCIGICFISNNKYVLPYNEYGEIGNFYFNADVHRANSEAFSISSETSQIHPLYRFIMLPLLLPIILLNCIVNGSNGINLINGYMLCMIQVIFNVISTIVFYKILKQTKIKEKICFLGSILFIFSFSNIWLNIIPETYSMTLTMMLLMFYYYLKNNKSFIAFGILSLGANLMCILPIGILVLDMFIKNRKKLKTKTKVIIYICTIIMIIVSIPICKYFIEYLCNWTDKSNLLEKIQNSLNQLLIPLVLGPKIINIEPHYVQSNLANTSGLVIIILLTIIAIIGILHKRKEIITKVGLLQIFTGIVLHVILGYGANNGIIYIPLYSWAFILFIVYGFDYINEKFKLKPNNAEGYEKPENVAVAQKKVNTLRNKIKDLGSINIDSIEEYKQTKERYDMMCEQRLDIESSITKLRKIITEMTSVMKEQFSEKFKLKYVQYGLIGTIIIVALCNFLWIKDFAKDLSNIEYKIPEEFIKNNKFNLYYSDGTSETFYIINKKIIQLSTGKTILSGIDSYTYTEKSNCLSGVLINSKWFKLKIIDDEIILNVSEKENKIEKEMFYIFGMGLRDKYILRKNDKYELVEYNTGNVILNNIQIDKIDYPNYTVYAKDINGNSIVIYENEEGIYINKNGKIEILQDNIKINIPTFENYKHKYQLRMLFNEIMINITKDGPKPNFIAYESSWYRDAAIVSMVLEKTDNISQIENWILNLDKVYDMQNGEKELDNLGQVLYLASLTENRNNAIIEKVQNEIEKNITQEGYLNGITDGSYHPVYQTKWLIYGLKKLGLDYSKYKIPDIIDSYSNLIWFDEFEDDANENIYYSDERWEYIKYAYLHYNKEKVDFDYKNYPLSLEYYTSKANYKKMEMINENYYKARLIVPHSWAAAEMYLYLIDIDEGKIK